MGCFLGGVHDRSPELLCPLHIGLPLPSTSRELKTDPKQLAEQCLLRSHPLRDRQTPGEAVWDSSMPSRRHTVGAASAQAGTLQVPFLTT